MAVNVLMIGTGEYTTGWVHGAATPSDKGAGVVALTVFDLKSRGLVDQVAMAGTNGSKFPQIRTHFAKLIAAKYANLETDFVSFPADHVTRNPDAYRTAISQLSRGDVVTVFTPDDTHFEIALAAVRHGCHVLIAKPLVKTLAEHRALVDAAEEENVIVAMEVHKRWDPIYADARDRISNLGDFSLFQSYMSQPKSQLDTFRSWAGVSSDISYYLNAHHIDFHVWSVRPFARPTAVYATAASGVACQQNIPTEDSISLTVSWENITSGHFGTANYTASWIAPPSDVHSQQRFFYMGHRGEVRVDQAHRGFSLATDVGGFASPNPLFMKYEPNSAGVFAGQHGYGYRSIEDFVRAAVCIREGAATPQDYCGKLANAHETEWVTGILEAGRRSLDQGGQVVHLDYDGNRLRRFA